MDRLSKKSQSMLVAMQLALPEHNCDLLEIIKTQHFLDEEFTGNPQHLITICNKKLDNTDLHVFELLYSLVRELIENSLVQIDGLGEKDDMLTTNVRKRRELLVVTNAHLQKLDFLDLKLSQEKKKIVNNIGILNVAENVFYLNDLFGEFLVSVYLIHKFKIAGIQAPAFSDQLAEMYPNKDFSVARMLLNNFLMTTGIFEHIADELSNSLDVKNILCSC